MLKKKKSVNEYGLTITEQDQMNSDLSCVSSQEEAKQFNEFRHLRRVAGANALVNKVELDMAYASVERPILKTACREADKNKIGAISVLPCFVKACVAYLGKDPQVSLIGVISYPFGADVTDVKVHAVKCAIADGVDEVEVSAPMSIIKDGNWSLVKKEFKKLVKASHGRVVRLFCETSFLTMQELHKTCALGLDCGISYFVLSASSVRGGVTVEQVKALSAVLKDKGFIKVNNVDDKDTMSRLLDAGVVAVGSRNAIQLVGQILSAAE